MQHRVIPLSSHMCLLHCSNDSKGNIWVPNYSVFPKQLSQSCHLSPFPYSHHWSRRAVLPPALSWAHLGWSLGGCMQSCQTGSQTEQKKEAPSSMLLYITSEVKGLTISTNTVSFNNLLFLFSCPATISSFRYVSLAALCTWSNSPAYFWLRFSFGFTRGKKEWYQKERRLERKVRKTKP